MKEGRDGGEGHLRTKKVALNRIVLLFERREP